MTQFTPSFRLLADYLEDNGCVVQTLDLGSDTGTYVTIRSLRGGQMIMNADHPTYPFASAAARNIYKDKQKSYYLVESLGLTTPATLVTDGYDKEAQEFLDRHGKVIVKPRSGQGSRGLSLNITNADMLRAAIDKALIGSKGGVLLQRQFIGEEVRFMLFNGHVEAALLREKPHVIGDGVATIRQLIELENEARRSITHSAVPYPQLDDSVIDSMYLTSHIVPKAGERVELGLGTMIRTGASIYDIRTTIHQSYLAIAEKIAEKFGKGILAIDIMIADLFQPAEPENYIFLEMNNDPALILFYSCRDGHNVDIVGQHLGPMLINAIEGRK